MHRKRGDATPIGLIRELLPDVLIKGAGDGTDRVFGADLIRVAGGRWPGGPDGVGFEPTVGLHPRRFSRPLP